MTTCFGGFCFSVPTHNLVDSKKKAEYAEVITTKLIPNLALLLARFHAIFLSSIHSNR